MTARTGTHTALRYNLAASKQFFYIEVFLHLAVLLGLVNLIAWPEVVLFGILFLLLTYRYFARFSVLTQYDQPNSLEIRPQTGRIIWHDTNGVRDFPFDAAKIHMTRWFILLQLGKGAYRIERILMEDSFTNVDQYCHCRRTLIELNLC